MRAILEAKNVRGKIFIRIKPEEDDSELIWYELVAVGYTSGDGFYFECEGHTFDLKDQDWRMEFVT